MSGGFTVHEVGDHFPDLRLQKVSGQTLRITDFRGARLLIFSWSSW